MLVDSHAHLDFLPEGKTIEDVLTSAKEAGVRKIITIGTSVEASKKCVEIAETKKTNEVQIFASAGIHPEDGKDEIKASPGLYHYINILKQIVEASNKVIAIGECGLDYYLKSDKQEATSNKERDFQRELFLNQIKLAQKLNLPLIVHCRNAWDEIFEIISKSQTPNSKLRGVFHSWTGDWETAKKALALGFYISFSGIVTFKNAQNIQEVAKNAPLDRILLETDSPFLCPEPLRGKQNEPKNVKIIAEFAASLRNTSFDKIAAATSANCEKLFNL